MMTKERFKLSTLLLATAGVVILALPIQAVVAGERIVMGYRWGGSAEVCAGLVADMIEFECDTAITTSCDEQDQDVVDHICVQICWRMWEDCFATPPRGEEAILKCYHWTLMAQEFGCDCHGPPFDPTPDVCQMLHGYYCFYQCDEGGSLSFSPRVAADLIMLNRFGFDLG